MNTKIWKVSFDVQYSSWSYVKVVAPNAKCALQKALSKVKGNYYNRLQDVSSIELESETTQ